LGLIEKIVAKTAKIGIIELGYVGLALVVALAKAGLRMLGIDVQQERVDWVIKGQSYT
jgi:UDP-N-acetyl-D-glucosamine dehydrogenase